MKAADRSWRHPRPVVVVAILTAAAGFGAGMVTAAQFSTVDGAPAAAAPVAATVTSTASPPANPPVTAPVIDDSTATPSIAVAPAFDLEARSIDDPASLWVVVNKRRPVDPRTWEPVRLQAVPGGSQMTPEAADALVAMREAAAAAGASFSVGTAYRSHGYQAQLHADYVAQFGSERADTFSARAGYSEHQTGLAADIYQSTQCRLKPCFGEEEAGRWVAEHAHEHGFIVRYPDGATDVTGYRYEPWHVRYVGVDLATHMHAQGLATMEEAFGLEAAPGYP